MKYSIVVPVYNVESYIHRCVDSLMDQTFTDLEILLIDDGSFDLCPVICDEYACKDKRIKVIHKSNGGLSDARNVGINNANGDYIIFVDSDDYIECDTCEKMLPFTNYNYDVIIGDGISEGGISNLDHISVEEVMNGPDYLKRAIKAGKAPMATWLNIFKRDFLINNHLYFKKGILHEDEHFTPRALLKAESVVVTNVLFYHYIIRKDSITTQPDKRKNANDFYDTCIELEELYSTVEDSYLKNRLLDSLAVKYLSLFQSGKLYQYGHDYYHKDMVLRNAKCFKTRIKVCIYLFSPIFYWQLNNFFKSLNALHLSIQKH